VGIESLPLAAPGVERVIRDAYELIDEATMRLAAIDRALAALQRRLRRPSALTPAESKALRAQIASVRAKVT
jgi:hypothetical protein